LRPLRALEPHDPEYPPRLHDLGDARPRVLYACGAGAWPATPLVAIVGARAASGYARGVTRRLVASLAAAGVGVVSGLARGVDRAAHAAALARGAWTGAVVGTGPDRIYPAEHAPLYTALVTQGLVVSELPPGT